jgi:hypothetical protein
VATSQVSPGTRSSDMTQQARTRVPMSTRRRLARWRVTARRPSSSLRRLPDILIIGAQRCGTSSLYKYLGQHPAVIPSIRKEVEYFSTRYTEGLAWYKSHFPLRRPSSMGQSLTFEATPDYLLHPLSAERASALVPDARVIALLRDPVSRAYSQYQHNRRLGHEPLSFDAALDAEESRIGGELERIKVDPVHPARMLRRHGYVERGKYDEQLERWLERFPPNNIHVVRSEDFFSSPNASYQEILRFLELPFFEPAEFLNYSPRRKAAHVSSEANGAPGMGQRTRMRLQEAFEPHILGLERMLDRDFRWR